MVEVSKLAKQHNCSFKVFDLEDVDQVNQNLSQIHTVLNCAGPFRFTAKKLIDACLASQTNYIDITGEIDVIDYAWSKNEEAKKNGIVILPSAGFDVIPTDCLSKKLSEKMPDANQLELAILNNGKISRGTFLTTLEMMREVGKIRTSGKIIDSEIGEYFIKHQFNKLKINGVSIPWGDVCSAFYSTGIPNIKVYLHLPPVVIYLRKVLAKMLKVLSVNFVFKIIKKIISKNLTGPDKKTRDKSSAIIWGRVTNSNGENYEEAYEFIDGYSLTAIGAADCADALLNDMISSGTTSPSILFGSEFMNKFVIHKIS